MSEPLITRKLSALASAQIANSSDTRWTEGSVREDAKDLIQIDGTIVRINPKSNKPLGAECTGPYGGGKVLTYAAFDIITERYFIMSRGTHEIRFDKNKAATRKAVAFHKDDKGTWHCFRWQTDGIVEIDLREPRTAEERRLKTCFQERHDAVDLVLAGAYAEYDCAKAPKLLDYFGKLLTMSREDAIAYIEEHEQKKIAQDEAYHTAHNTNVTVLDEFTVDGEKLRLEEIAAVGKRITAEIDGEEFSVNSKDAQWMSYVLSQGGTLSFQS